MKITGRILFLHANPPFYTTPPALQPIKLVKRVRFSQSNAIDEVLGPTKLTKWIDELSKLTIRNPEAEQATSVLTIALSGPSVCQIQASSLFLAEAVSRLEMHIKSNWSACLTFGPILLSNTKELVQVQYGFFVKRR